MFNHLRNNNTNRTICFEYVLGFGVYVLLRGSTNIKHVVDLGFAGISLAVGAMGCAACRSPRHHAPVVPAADPAADPAAAPAAAPAAMSMLLPLILRPAAAGNSRESMPAAARRRCRCFPLHRSAASAACSAAYHAQEFFDRNPPSKLHFSVKVDRARGDIKM